MTPVFPPRTAWFPRVSRLGLLCASLLAPLAAGAQADAAPVAPLQGSRQITLHSRDGGQVLLGTVQFSPQADGRSRFAIAWRHAALQDFFLSMREFKCVPAATEVLCHVPYPYPQPGTVAPGDLAWLEHALLFMFKTPSEFGAKLWNGVYFQLRPQGTGFEGRPQAVDLNLIAAPPARPEQPPFRPALRDDIAPQARWFNRLTLD